VYREEILATLSEANEPTTLEIISSLSPLAVLLSAVLAFIVGWKAIAAQRRMARNRATLDVLFRLEGDPEFLRAASAFKDIRDGRGLLSLTENDEKKSNRDREEEFFVDVYLNHLKLICVGISEDTIDELFVFQYMRGSIVHDWHSASQYVLKSRELYNNLRMYQKLELFAVSWDGGTPKFVTRKDSPSKYMDSNTQTSPVQT
jgi:hypothetical protein